VGKTYRIAKNRDDAITLAEQLLRRVRHPLKRIQYEPFTALDDITFEVPWGEAVGIIGRNGAGKSTLLKLLTRITAPTRGRIELGGRVGSLLEVGTGFHPELTGRENVYLNGTLLGMRRKEIQRRFDEIVTFSGVEKFLETPVKRYSSGMYVRLAFAVAAHLETEILAVDEVLAVGDAEFQRKCLDKMREVATDGRTVLLVSHQIQNIEALCTTAMYLEAGGLKHYGDVTTAAHLYRSSFAAPTSSAQTSRRQGTGQARFASATADKEQYTTSEPKWLRFTVPAHPGLAGEYFVSAHLVNSDGIDVLQCDSRVAGRWFDPKEAVDTTLAIDTPWLKPGRYSVDLFLCQAGVLDAWHGACGFTVLPLYPYEGTVTDDAVELGTVLADFSFKDN